MGSANSTGNAILKSHGLELHKFRPMHVIPFFESLSEANKKEFDVVYETDPLEAILSAMTDQMVFVVTRGDKVLALTGVNDGLMWALFSSEMPRHWVRFARASRDLIDFYHHFYPKLMCDVWVENEMIHHWLAVLGFDAESIITLHNEEDLVRFVRCKTEQDNIYSFVSRPVMH